MGRINQMKQQLLDKIAELVALINEMQDGDLAAQVAALQEQVASLQSELTNAKSILSSVNAKAKEIDAAIEDPA